MHYRNDIPNSAISNLSNKYMVKKNERGTGENKAQHNRIPEANLQIDDK